ncbi:hypothetical protein A1O3_08380 [Capronia epimyces CBS 606.96]|uniref:laccase n=1 Tax=Capronia epimyces CBS 606.96 TaxID=1182542 RepID=W9YCN2_9EURO|nr:uncharacterized protein A1O3_08380 [Capronia epimyces CBS 606.96]EXJ80094.1 hypothetical protein A1O3_08380 [Capronia epimyces CBS 606.96]
MRSFPLFLATAAVGLVNASKTSSTSTDVTVKVTATRTHTVCPLTSAYTCGLPTDVSGSSTVSNVAEAAWASLWDAQKSKYTGQWDDWNNIPPTTGASSSTPTTVTTSATSSGPGSHSSGIFSNGTSTGSTSSITGSSTTGLSTTSTSATTSGSCPSYTPVANLTDFCNSASDRSRWCHGKDLKTDYYKADYSTNVVRKYTFEITNTTLVFDGTGPQLALAINGQVPGPVIEANWGDTVEVTVINKLQDNSTSIHFHGIRQLGTNDQDGVPGVTECAIAGNGGSRTYRWHASSYGTSWYHSHSFAQYGDGIRGPIVIHGPATTDYDYDMGTVMIDDTFGIPAAAAAARIAHFGPGGSFNTLFNGKNKNPDGQAGESFQWSVKPCRKHLFRIINSSSQNSYIVGFDKHTMTVIAADFVPIVPYKTQTLNIANGQRYDVVVEMDQTPSAYFVRAVIQTQCPSGGANSGLGLANAIIAYEGSNSTATPVSQTPITSDTANICQDEPLESLVPYLQKPAGTSTSFQSSASTVPAGSLTSVATNDDGTVFNWFLNNAAINVNYSQPTLETLATGGSNTLLSNPVILNQANQWVYFVIQNQFFVSHPMHVHGHDVSVLGTGLGTFSSADIASLKFDNPTRRDTVMLQGSPGPGQPVGWTVIGFETDNPGTWLMHCHITWHLDGGLALQFIERPQDIDAAGYVNKPSYKDECSSLQAYEAANPYGDKLTGQSGLKRRTLYESLGLDGSQSAAKMHMDRYRKRHMGHGHAHY